MCRWHLILRHFRLRYDSVSYTHQSARKFRLVSKMWGIPRLASQNVTRILSSEFAKSVTLRVAPEATLVSHFFLLIAKKSAIWLDENSGITVGLKCHLVTVFQNWENAPKIELLTTPIANLLADSNFPASQLCHYNRVWLSQKGLKRNPFLSMWLGLEFGYHEFKMSHAIETPSKMCTSPNGSWVTIAIFNWPIL